MAVLTTVDEATGEEKTVEVPDYKPVGQLSEDDLKELTKTNYRPCQFVCNVNKKTHSSFYSGKVFLNEGRSLNIPFSLTEDQFNLIRKYRPIRANTENQSLAFTIPVIVRLFKGTNMYKGAPSEYVFYEILPVAKETRLVIRGRFDWTKLDLLHSNDPCNKLHIIDRGQKEIPSEFAEEDVSGNGPAPEDVSAPAAEA